MTIHFKKIIENICIQYFSDNLIINKIVSTSMYNKLNNEMTNKIFANIELTPLSSFNDTLIQKGLQHFCCYLSGALWYDTMKYFFPKISDSVLHTTSPTLHTLLYLSGSLYSVSMVDSQDICYQDKVIFTTVNSIIAGITSYMGAKYGHGMFTTNEIYYDDKYDNNDLQKIVLIDDMMYHSY